MLIINKTCKRGLVLNGINEVIREILKQTGLNQVFRCEYK